MLPILLMIVMLLLFFCLYSYQRTMLVQVSSAAAERAAFIWDNSHKAVNGSFAEGERDGLYWRIKDDRLLASLTGADISGNSDAMIQLPLADSGGAEGKGAPSDVSLPTAKLLRSAGMVPWEMTGEMNYRYALTGRRMTVKLKHILKLPLLDGLLFDAGNPETSSRSVVVEPVEFIRTIELMRYYGAKFRGGGPEAESGTGLGKEDASKVMGKLAKR